MRGYNKLSDPVVSGVMRFSKNAAMAVQQPNGTWADISLEELLALDATTNVETLAAARTLTADDSGKTLFLGLADGFTVTLPAPAAGLNFEFIVSVAPTTAYILTTDSGADVMIVEVDELTKTVGTEDGVYDDNADTLNFVASTAVVGDRVKMLSDGTSWFVHGLVNAIGAVTTSTT